LLETIDEDARIRLKALEMLGKVGSVGLFTERIEVDVKHRNIEDVDAELSTILEKYLGDVVPAEEDNELDEVIKERSLLEMSDEELGIPEPEQIKIEDLERVEDFDKP
jgi:hypothetical protein